MATKIGRIFVLLNLTLSLFCAGLAFGIYTNRVNWSGPLKSAPGAATQSLFAEAKAGLERETNSAVLAAGTWDKDRQELIKLENLRPVNKRWYADQLALLENGPRATALEYADNLLKMDKTDPKNEWRPALSPSDLKGRTPLVGEIRQVMTQIDQEIARTQGYLKEEERLTADIKDEKERIAEEQLARIQSEAEVKYLKPLVYNREVDVQFLVERKASLEARLSELRGGSGVAARRP
jgi:hypothetical protein